MQSELTTINKGLLVSQCQGLMRVIVESDSSDAVNLVNGYLDQSHPLLHLILECKTLHKSMRSNSITYVLINYNASADSLAKLGHLVCNNIGCVWFDEAPMHVISHSLI